LKRGAWIRSSENPPGRWFYYSKQMQGKTRMMVHLSNGEKLEGVIEWYDRECLKLNRTGAPNLLLFKHCIKYMHKIEPE
jgi:host factor-I protein